MWPPLRQQPSVQFCLQQPLSVNSCMDENAIHNHAHVDVEPAHSCRGKGTRVVSSRSVDGWLREFGHFNQSALNVLMPDVSAWNSCRISSWPSYNHFNERIFFFHVCFPLLLTPTVFYKLKSLWDRLSKFSPQRILWADKQVTHSVSLIHPLYLLPLFSSFDPLSLSSFLRLVSLGSQHRGRPPLTFTHVDGQEDNRMWSCLPGCETWCFQLPLSVKTIFEVQYKNNFNTMRTFNN